jgi:hypothetical protein
MVSWYFKPVATEARRKKIGVRNMYDIILYSTTLQHTYSTYVLLAGVGILGLRFSCGFNSHRCSTYGWV